MADVLAIVSKAIFEKAAGKKPALGTRLGLDRYVSKNKGLAPLADGGTLYLVTVRPPDEQLWLVAVLAQPTHDGNEWVVPAPCTTPLTNISDLRDQITFESGTGISAAPGALGMSLQTPRVLTAADAALLAAAASGTVAPVVADPGEARRRELLAQVVAHPDDLHARQVYADHLMASSDPRGELITVEIALAGRLSVVQRANLSLRRRELHAAHAETWWPWPLERKQSRNGFLHRITGTLKELLRLGPRIMAAEPVYAVEVLEVEEPDDARDLARASWLARVASLTIRGSLDTDGLEALARSPHLAGLWQLNVSNTGLEGSAIAALGNGLPACRSLVLTGNELGDDGAAALAAWPHLPHVERLYLTACALGNGGVGRLLERSLPRLVQLCLGRNELDDGDLTTLAVRAPTLSALEELEIPDNEFSKVGIRALVEASFPALRKLDLDAGFQSFEGVRARYSRA